MKKIASCAIALLTFCLLPHVTLGSSAFESLDNSKYQLSFNAPVKYEFGNSGGKRWKLQHQRRVASLHRRFERLQVEGQVKPAE